jgi:hypothetical protein
MTTRRKSITRANLAGVSANRTLELLLVCRIRIVDDNCLLVDWFGAPGGRIGVIQTAVYVCLNLLRSEYLSANRTLRNVI